MALNIPNIESSPSFDAQSVTDYTDVSAWLALSQGTGVISGMQVTPSAGMTVSVAPGAFTINNVQHSYAGGTVTISGAAAFDRKDIIVASGTTIFVVSGTNSTVSGWTRSSSSLPPVKPVIPSSSALVAEIYVGAATTTVAAGNIIDKTALNGISNNFLPTSGGTVSGNLVVVSGFTVSGTVNVVSGVISTNSIPLVYGSGNSANVPSGVAIGYKALAVNTTSGINNIAIGTTAMQANTSGSYNTVVGNQASYSGTTGGYITAIGYQAAYNNVTGGYITAIGYQAGQSQINSYGTYVGYRAGSNDTGSYNIIIGYNIGGGAGSNNVVVGAAATVSTYSGSSAIGYGVQLGGHNSTTIGSNSVGSSGSVTLGYSSSTIGATNTVAIGTNIQTAGASSVIMGINAGGNYGTNAMTINSGVAIGAYAGGYVSAGTSAYVNTGSVAIGAYAGTSIQINPITAVGFQAGYSAYGQYNTYIGYNSGYPNGTNASTLAIGQTLVGYNTGQANATQSNYITALGYGVTVGASGGVAIGVDYAGNSATTSVANQFVLGTVNHTVVIPGTFAASGVATVSGRQILTIVPGTQAGKNYIINGAMEIAQRGTSTSGSTTTAYGLDRWANKATVATGVYYSQSTNLYPSVNQYIQYFQQVAASGTTSTTWYLGQSLENNMAFSLQGQNVTLSFWYKIPVNFTNSVNVALQYATASGNQNMVTTSGTTIAASTGTNISTSTTAITANTNWTFAQATYAVPSGALSLGVVFSSLTNTVSSGLFQVTAVQLEIGSYASLFSRAGGTYQGELANCQRYFYRVGGNNTFELMGTGVCTTTANTAFVDIKFPVTMRSAPSLTAAAASGFGIITGVTTTVTGITLNNASVDQAAVQLVVSGTATVAGQGCILQAGNNTTATLQFSSELL